MSPELAAQLDRIERMLTELIARKRATRRAVGKRARSIDARRRSEVVQEPTELERAKARRTLRRAGLR